MRKSALLLILILSASTISLFGQERKVEGLVKDSQTLTALEGVTVSTGPENSTQTTETGEFSLNVSLGDSLTFTFIGYLPQTIPVGSEDWIDVFLRDESRALDEVVVIGYGTAQKRDLTGSIAQVKGEDIVDRPGTNPVANLQGKVAGLQVTNSGRPGQEPDVRLRGTNSINSVKPLYVVDGLLNDNINFLNPSDIESIEVLKDPSSLAIFGVRGANGVIAVTTKQAKKGQLNFEFNSRLAFKNVSKRMRLVDAEGFRTLYDEQRANQGDTTYDYSDWKANTDWQNEIFKTGIVNYNDLTVSGASDNNSFRMGLGYSHDEGVIHHERHKQLTLSLNDELRISDNIKTGIVFNGFRAQLPVERDVFGAILATPIAPVFNDDYGLYHALPDFQRAQVNNPLVPIEARKNSQIRLNYRAVANTFVEVDFLQDFSFRVNLSADYGFNQFRTYQGLVRVYNPDIEGEDKSEISDNTLTSVNQEQNKFYKYQTDWLLNYKKNIERHNLTLMLGYTTYMQGFEATTARRTQGEGMEIPNDPDYWFVDIGDAATQRGGGSGWEYRTLSYMARALYNYDNKYLLNASFRRDGSSAFSKGNPWQNFYALGAAWTVTNEDFMATQSLFDNLKIKASWGSLGNQDVGGNKYPMYPQLVAGNSTVFGNKLIPAYGPEYIPDPDLHWEVVKSWESGVELSAFENRLELEGVYYNKVTDDVLVRIPGIFGSLPGLGNLGRIRNNGIEAAASWHQPISEDWDFNIGGNITTVNNKVIELSTEGYNVVSGPSRTEAGYPIGYFYGYVHDGIFQTETEVEQAPENKLGSGDFKPGDIRFRDTNGDGVIDVDDRTMIGDPTPDFYYGLSLGTRFKNFNIQFEFQGVHGNEIMRTWNQNQFATYNFLQDRMQRWNGEGTSHWEPILDEGRANNRQYSTYFIEEGSFFRLRDITLSYTFPVETLQQVRLKNLRVFLNAQNVFTLSKNTGYTPEIGGSAISFGIDNGTYPVPSVYTMGVSLNF